MDTRPDLAISINAERLLPLQPRHLCSGITAAAGGSSSRRTHAAPVSRSLPSRFPGRSISTAERRLDSRRRTARLWRCHPCHFLQGHGYDSSTSSKLGFVVRSQHGSSSNEGSPDHRIQRMSEAIRSSLTFTRRDGFVHEIVALAVPVLMSQAIEPVAQLLDTAYVGRLGSVELAAVGVSVSVFNLVSKVFNLPLLSITTSFVAEDYAISGLEYDSELSRKRIVPAVSSALFLGSILAVMEAVILLLGVGFILSLMGVPTDSQMRYPATKYLALRALGAPANVMALTIQGIFRGFKDTRTPLYAIAASNICNILLTPILMFVFGFGVIGAAIGTVTSQYFLALLLSWKLNKQVILIPPNLSSIRLNRFLKSGGFLLGRTMSVLFTMTLATSMAARQGAIPMAGHQILMQIWLATSLLSDALALAGQTLVATAHANGDLKRVKDLSFGVLKMGLGFGLFLSLFLSVILGRITQCFTEDPAVKAVFMKGVLFVAGTQPLNVLAFVFDGIHYGVSDFQYAACSMMLIGLVSSICLLISPSYLGLPGVWLGLSLLMGLRAAAGWWRLSSATGPWKFLKEDLMLGGLQILQ